MTSQDKHDQLIELLWRVMRDERWNYDVIDASNGEIIIPAGRLISSTLFKRVVALPEIILRKYQPDDK